MSVKENGQSRITTAHLFQQQINILHQGFERWRMAAWPARLAMPAQIEAHQRIARLVEGLAHMSKSPDVLAVAMYQCHDCFRLLIRFPASGVELQTLSCRPSLIQMFS